MPKCDKVDEQTVVIVAATRGMSLTDWLRSLRTAGGFGGWVIAAMDVGVESLPVDLRPKVFVVHVSKDATKLDAKKFKQKLFFEARSVLYKSRELELDPWHRNLLLESDSLSGGNEKYDALVAQAVALKFVVWMDADTRLASSLCRLFHDGIGQWEPQASVYMPRDPWYSSLYRPSDKLYKNNAGVCVSIVGTAHDSSQFMVDWAGAIDRMSHMRGGRGKDQDALVGLHSQIGTMRNGVVLYSKDWVNYVLVVLHLRMRPVLHHMLVHYNN